MRAKFVLSEVATGLFRNVTMTIAMVLTTAISLALLGAGGLIVTQVGKMKDLFYYRLEVSIFMKQDVTADQRDALRERLASDPLVANTVYENKEEAYSRFREQFKDSPELVQNVRPDALPESFRVKLVDPTKYELAAQRYAALPGVERVVDQRRILDRLFGILDTLRSGALVIALVQGVAALLLIGNTIQVAAYSRRREVAIMRLVGASNWYIQLPFVLEAALAGLVGAVLGWGALVVVKFAFVDRMLHSAFTGVIPTWEWTWLLYALPSLAGIAILLSGLAGWLTLRFQIKV
ncbi:MAG TPA: permease-like cell division protein FtsX [Mycobacteriales bacterium]|jgi:cell division transport system permease protein